MAIIMIGLSAKADRVIQPPSMLIFPDLKRTSNPEDDCCLRVRNLVESCLTSFLSIPKFNWIQPTIKEQYYKSGNLFMRSMPKPCNRNCPTSVRNISAEINWQRRIVGCGLIEV